MTTQPLRLRYRSIKMWQEAAVIVDLKFDYEWQIYWGGLSSLPAAVLASSCTSTVPLTNECGALRA